MTYYDTASTGTYAWAMAQVSAHRDVRRAGWPIEVEKAGKVMPGGCGTTYNLERDYVRIWHVYRTADGHGICKGWNSGVVGADGEGVGDLGMDSGGYYAKPEDLQATDWMLVSEVTKEQIAERDANRFPHHPNTYGEDREREQQNHTLRFWLIVGALILAIIFLAAWWNGV